ncbi:PREDICTED: uncharacterized protein LOC108560003 [Nicrophorus vespilloides]|uniref:Uncharacterized protein LOC108560003 n=1 Tax=Nicrophorus vespilloides TaxID=110193 RepID=A0ABM1MEA3_NICVS|nr:PREDICTED: uncharacterized protein LOC108560003 [Nicrophorus vespilloides]
MKTSATLVLLTLSHFINSSPLTSNKAPKSWVKDLKPKFKTPENVKHFLPVKSGVADFQKISAGSPIFFKKPVLKNKEPIMLLEDNRIFFPDEISDEAKNDTDNGMKFNVNIEVINSKSPKLQEINLGSPCENGRTYCENVASYPYETIKKLFEDGDVNLEYFSIEDDNELLTDLEPKCAQGKTYCDYDDTYPYDVIYDMMKNDFGHKDFFVTDEKYSGFWDGISGNEDEKYMCETRSKIIHPMRAKTVNGKWKYIVNLDDGKHVQAVKVEICKRPNLPCKMTRSFPMDHLTNCRQRTTFRRLLALSDFAKVEPDTFLIPSECSCAYKKYTDSAKF